MNSNTLLVAIIDGGLILFFLYALYYISQLSKQQEPSIMSKRQEEPPLTKRGTDTATIPREGEEVESIQEKEVHVSDESSMEGKLDSDKQSEESKVKDMESMVKERLEGIDIIDVEGIGPAYSSKLYEIDINTVSDLLEIGGSPSGRDEIAEKTEISPKLVLEWVNHADLYRIKGVEGQFADLLEEAGVDTVPELARRNPENLYNKIIEVNEEKNLVNTLPEIDDVKNWVEQAKALPRVIHY